MSAARDHWERYASHPHFVLGFHGCDALVGESLLRGQISHLKPSKNDYDWLGHGIYFWEDSPQRALEFAQERVDGGRNSKGNIQTPFVVGAVINLLHCFNLMDRTALIELRGAYDFLESLMTKSREKLPTNGENLLSRKLDCAVFTTLQGYRKDNGLPPYDTVRGLFFEGDPLYPGAGFKSKDHIQICVQDTRCILGYFKPLVD